MSTFIIEYALVDTSIKKSTEYTLQEQSAIVFIYLKYNEITTQFSKE